MENDDRQLIDQCLAGHGEAFSELVSRYQNRIFNTVYRMVGRFEDAQDIVQEVFVRA